MVGTYTLLCCSGITTEPRWVKLLSSGLLLWWSLNGGWTALVTTLLATTVSACFCLDTVGTPVAAKFAHVALNNTYITGFFYRAVILVRAAIFMFLTCFSSALTATADAIAVLLLPVLHSTRRTS